MQTDLTIFARNGDLQALRDAVDKGADVNAIETAYQWTALQIAARFRQPECVAFLLERGAQVNVVDRYGRSPLMEASEKECVPCLNLLLRSAAVVDARDNAGKTALMYAAEHSKPEAVKILVMAGANMEARSSSLDWTSLFWAVTRGQVHATKALLVLDMKADPTVTSASEMVVRFLVEQGADVTVTDKHGWTPLDYARDYGLDNLIRILEGSV